MADIRKATLDVILDGDKIVGFKVEGYDNGRMDGQGIHLSSSKISISPIEGDDAPNVFRVREQRYFLVPIPPPILQIGPRISDEYDKEYIVLGEQKAVQKGYQLALNWANFGVEFRSRCLNQDNSRYGYPIEKVVLADNAKDKIPK